MDLSDNNQTARSSGLLTIAAWVSVCLFFASRFDFASSETIEFWSITSVVCLASCVGLSERRRRRTESEAKELRQAATTDPLTGVANRRWLDIELKRRLAQLKRQGTPFSIVMIDIDHFKQINDQRGHDAGDLILKALSNSVNATLRDMDLLTRLGGEEFLAVLPGTNIKQAAIAGERIRNSVEQLIVPIGDRELKVTASVGITEALDGDHAETLIKRADDALYTAKKSGRNASFVKSNVKSDCFQSLEQLVCT